MADFDLSITICSWNTIDDLRACLKSLDEAKDEGGFEVIVIENNSEDGSGEMVEQEFPQFRLFKEPRNLGFTGGHNKALENINGRHAALLNSDTVVHPGAIKALLAALESEPDLGVVGPKLLNPDGSLQMSCRRFPNPIAAAFRSTFLGRLFPKNKWTREYLMADFQHDQVREVDWVSGAALFIHERALKAVGHLDPHYFMFCEDTDYCRRVHDEGMRVVYYPQAVITHAIGRSTDKAPNRMIGRHHRSMLRYYAKHQVPRQFVLLRPFSLAFAAFALGVRATPLIIKNKIQALQRRMGK